MIGFKSELLFDGKFKTIPEGEIIIGTSEYQNCDGKGYVEEKRTDYKNIAIQ